MSYRIVCLHHSPQPGDYGWADVLVHPDLSLRALYAIAQEYAWKRPLKICLQAGGAQEGWSEEPLVWIALHALFREECAVSDEDYSSITVLHEGSAQSHGPSLGQ